MWLRSFASVDPPPMVLTINPCRPCWTLVIFFKISGVVSHTIYFWNEVGDSNFVCFISDTVTHYLSAVKLKKQSIDWKIFARTPQASEVSGILKKNSAQKMRLRRPPFQIWTGSQAVYSVQLEIGGKDKNLQLTRHPSQSQKNLLFTIFNAFISELGASLAQEQPNYILEWNYKPCRKPFGQNLLDGMTWQKRSLVAECCSNWCQQYSNFGLLWRWNSQRNPRTCILEAETLSSVSG